MKLKVLKSGNRIVLDSDDQDLVGELIHAFTFQALDFNHGKRGANRVTERWWPCATRDAKLRFATNWGFYPRLLAELKKRGIRRVVLEDLAPPKDPSIFEPQWSRLFEDTDIELRDSQYEFLVKFFSNVHGQFDLPTAFGKSFMIGVIGILLPRAKIHVVTRKIPVLRDRIYPELVGMLSNVGIIGGGEMITGRRIMCISTSSLHHSRGDADILIGDEHHEIAADKTSGSMGVYLYSRNYGLSASVNMRLDKKDFRCEAIFGPVIMKREYLEAVAEGIVVPIEVEWSSVILDYDPCDGIKHDTARARAAYWNNIHRNRAIAADARRYDEDTQVLITVNTIEHALRLRKLLPEFTVVYAVDGLDPTARKKFIKKRLLHPDHPRMDNQRFRKLTKLFENNKLKKVICTTCWNVGVDFRDLAVLIRGDGGGSPVNDVQIPGRTSRLGRKTAKSAGTIHDYLDQFNKGARRKALSRYRSYHALGFTQICPKGCTPRLDITRDNYLEDEDP